MQVSKTLGSYYFQYYAPAIWKQISDLGKTDFPTNSSNYR